MQKSYLSSQNDKNKLMQEMFNVLPFSLIHTLNLFQKLFSTCSSKSSEIFVKSSDLEGHWTGPPHQSCNVHAHHLIVVTVSALLPIEYQIINLITDFAEALYIFFHWDDHWKTMAQLLVVQWYLHKPTLLVNMISNEMMIFGHIIVHIIPIHMAIVVTLPKIEHTQKYRSFAQLLH